MSVKIRMIIGFVIILFMVTFQSLVIVKMNKDKDTMANEILHLYQLNMLIKERVTDIVFLQNDLLNRINNMMEIPAEMDEQQPTSCLGIMQSMEQWRSTFISSDEYKEVADARKYALNNFLAKFDDLRAGIDEIREIESDDSVTRMNLYETMISPVVYQENSLAKDIIGTNSLRFAMRHKNMQSITSTIAFVQFAVILLAIALIIAIFIYSQYILQPLNWLMTGVAQIKKGDFTFKVKKRSNDELGRLALQFNEMSEEIATHRNHLELLVEQRTEELKEAMDELEQTNENLTITNHNLEEARHIMNFDMKMAANIQSKFFPKTPPAATEWDIALKFVPMNMVSGDMYDFYVDKDGELAGLTLMDVSGHGVGSGLITMLAKSITARLFLSNYRSEPINTIMEMINKELIAEVGTLDNYLTGILMKMDGSRIEYVNAAHTDVIIKRAATGTTELLKPKDDSSYKALFLGIEDMEMPMRTLEFSVETGDLVFVYSDCLNESFDANQQQFGMERIVDSIAAEESNDPSVVIERVCKDLLAFTGGAELKDDLTILCLVKK